MCDIQVLHVWMQQHGISQTMLAKRLQCIRSTINRILNGKSKASPMLKARIKELMAEQEATITAVGLMKWKPCFTGGQMRLT